jgi:hypothetical protein
MELAQHLGVNPSVETNRYGHAAVNDPPPEMRQPEG